MASRFVMLLLLFAGCAAPGTQQDDRAMADRTAIIDDVPAQRDGTVSPDRDGPEPVDRVGPDGDGGTLPTDAGIDAPPTSGYPARPAAGTLLWGAGIDGNGDPARHEMPTGETLALRRTFFQWSQRTTGLMTIASDDVAKGRLPWVSLKPPSWADMAAGMHDAEIDELLVALKALGGPVWLTIHHEPEGGGGVNSPDDPAGPAGHLAMNQRVRERIEATDASNVALAIILMSYTWNPSSGRDPEQWWAPGVYDVLGIDHYSEQEASLLTPVWLDVRAWAAEKDVEIAVAEWGLRGTDAAAGQHVREWYDHAAGSNTDSMGARVVGLAAFDSGLNSPSGSWELVGEQLTVFRALMSDPRTAHVGP